MATALDAYDELFSAIGADFPATKAIAVSTQLAFAGSRAWLNKFQSEYNTNAAARLIRASGSASVEAVSAVSLGLARPAVFSLRSHYELFLMFLYYRDHPRELSAAAEEIEYMKLPGEVSKYLKRYYIEYEKRWKTLDASKKRPSSEGYSRMSEIVHGSSTTAAPSAVAPKDVHFSAASLTAITALVEDIVEELSDLATAAHEGNWMSLPAEVQAGLTVRGLDDAFKAM